MKTLSTIEDRCIRKRYNVPKSAYDVVSDELENFGTDSTHLFKHVLIAGAFDPEGNRWVRVSDETLEEELPGASPDALTKNHLLEEREPARGASSSWRVRDDLYLEFVNCFSVDSGEPRFDLFSGEKTDWTYRSKKYDSNRNARPELLQKAMEALSQGAFHWGNVRDHFRESNDEIAELQDTVGSYWRNSPEYRADRKRLQAAKARLARDKMCIDTLANQNLTFNTNGIPTYELAYRPTTSGLLTHRGGGLQACSEEMRTAAYGRLEDVHAYRIPSAMPAMLRSFAGEAGVETRFLDYYLGDPLQKPAHANLVDVDEDTLEAALNRLCLEGKLVGRDPEAKRWTADCSPETGHTDLKRLFRRAFQKKHGHYDPDASYEEFDRFHTVARDVYRTLNHWYVHLEIDWIPRNRYGGPGGYWIKNDVGCSIPVPQGYEDADRKSRILSFLLEGRLAYFIHTLTVEAYNHGMRVLSNEHNGIVTHGELPESVIQAVKEKTGMEQLCLRREEINDRR